MREPAIHFLINPGESVAAPNGTSVWVFESVADAKQREALSRRVVARHLGIDAAGIRFEKDPHGRTFVEGAAVDVSFSHAAGLFVAGVCPAGRIGVDVEILRDDFDFLSVAGGHFTVAERARLDSFAPPDRPEAFFRIWTAKEALAKAIGHGFSLGFDHVETAPLPDGTLRIARIQNNEQQAKGWELSHTLIGQSQNRAIIATVVGATHSMSKQA